MVIPINKKAELEFQQYRSLHKQLLRARLDTAPKKRASRLTRPSECVICSKEIRSGEMYHDAGYRNRAHESCLKTSL